MKTDDSTIHNDDITAPCETRTVADTEIAKKASVKKLNTIEKGATILDLYRVESDPFVGGMGKVFRVHHTGWNVDLALKQPKREMFQNERQKAMFVNECEAWINLGLHPHIVSCYYVREIDGTPSIFSEWMDAGSLSGHITDSETGNLGKLYAGNDETVLERILDISIQFARGLHYAHEQGLIHQDVKPDNVLMSKTGEVKVADFGIAKARSALLSGAVSGGMEGGTMISESGGYTPAYCSPEQAGRKPLTRRTDIWSWAVSVLEMFIGGRSWQYGQAVGAGCDDFFDMSYVPVPESMKTLLRWCFKENEAERPRNFQVVETELLKIYKEQTGNGYQRPEPKAAADTADSLNNRALSFLDIGKPEEAERCWERAILIDNANFDVIFNYTCYLWRKTQIDDEEAHARIFTSYENNKKNKHAQWLYAHFCLESNRLQLAAELFGALLEDINYPDAKQWYDYANENKNEYRLIEKTSFGFKPHITKDGKFMIVGSNVDKYPSDIYRVLTKISIDNFRAVPGFKKNENVCETFQISPDEKYLIFKPFGAFHELGIIDLQTFEKKHSLPWDKYFYLGMGFSKDCKQVFVLIGNDGAKTIKEIKTWDLETGQCLQTIDIHIENVSAFHFSLDGMYILICESNGKISKCEIATGRLILLFELESKSPIKTIDISEDGRFALLGSREVFFLIDIAAEKCIKSYQYCSSQYVNSLIFFRFCKNQYAYSAAKTNANSPTYHVKLWDLNSGKSIYTHNWRGHKIYFSPFPDGNKILISNDLGEFAICPVPKQHIEGIWSLSRIKNLRELINNEDRFKTIIAKIEKKMQNKEISEALTLLKEARDIPEFSGNKTAIDINREIGKYCTIAGVRSIIDFGKMEYPQNRLDLEIFKQSRHVFKSSNGLYYRCRFIDDVDGNINYVSLVNKDGELNKRIYTQNEKYLYIRSIAVNPDETYLAINNYDRMNDGGVVIIWDLTKEKKVRTLRHREIKKMYFHPVEPKLIVATDRKVIIWNTVDFTKREFKIDASTTDLSFDGNSILCALTRYCSDRVSPPYSVKSLNIKTGEVKKLTTDRNDLFSTVTFGADQKHALFHSREGTITYVDVVSGKTIIEAKLIGEFYYMSPVEKDIFYACDQKYLLDFEYDFPGWADWDEGARPYLNIFLALHPDWTDDDFEKILIPDLQNRGYGWLRPEGVRAQLEADRLWNQLTDL